MAKSDIISRLRLDSGEFDSKIKRAGQELLAYSEHCKKVSLQMGFANKDAVDFAKALGSMQTTSQTARGKINELSEALVNAKVMFKNMTDAERNSEFGRNLATSLDQLKGRLQSAKKDLADVQQELSGSKFGQLGNIVDGIGQKMGLNANITELLTSKTALMSAGIGAAGAIVGKATQEWAKYNAELAKQDQITTVTTGLKGADSDRMTDQARALTDTYGVDFREAINAANTLMTQFGQTGEQAMSLIRDGMQGMIQGDGPKLLSMIQQYAPAFRDAGVTASQLVAVIQNSEGGIFTDQNMNAIVMGIKNIRLMTKATSDALAQLGIDGQKMSQQLRDGSMTIFDALKQVATQIQSVNSNSQAAGEVMQQVFGRQGAMAGTKLGEAIATLNTNLEETKRQTGEVGDAYNDLYNANVKLNGAIRDCFEYDGWDQMATGIKANLVNALASVLDYLGKIKGALGGFSVGQQQGDTRNGGGQFVDRAVDRLRGGNTPGKQQIYTRQVQAYSGKILDINDQIRQIQEKAAQDMDGNMAVVYEKQIRNLENRKQAIQRNMAEYDKRAQAVLNGTDMTPAITITPTITTSGGATGGSGGGSRGGKGFDIASIAFNPMSDSSMKFDPSQHAQASGLRPENILGPSDEWEKYKDTIAGSIGSIGESMSNLTEWTPNFDPFLKKQKEMTKAAKQQQMAFNMGAEAAANLGAAFASMEDPAAKAAGTVISAIANIALGFGMAVAQASSMGPWAWLAYVAAGTAALATTISTVHSLTGYAEGGIIKGNSYSGDNIGGMVDGGTGGFVGLNAGEIVLNKSQQNALAGQLQGNGINGINLSGRIKGTDIILSVDRSLQLQGKQLLTWG